jgi:hypothetical protein
MATCLRKPRIDAPKSMTDITPADIITEESERIKLLPTGNLPYHSLQSKERQAHTSSTPESVSEITNHSSPIASSFRRHLSQAKPMQARPVQAPRRTCLSFCIPSNPIQSDLSARHHTSFPIYYRTKRTRVRQSFQAPYPSLAIDIHPQIHQINRSVLLSQRHHRHTLLVLSPVLLVSALEPH